MPIPAKLSEILDKKPIFTDFIQFQQINAESGSNDYDDVSLNIDKIMRKLFNIYTFSISKHEARGLARFAYRQPVR